MDIKSEIHAVKTFCFTVFPTTYQLFPPILAALVTGKGCSMKCVIVIQAVEIEGGGRHNFGTGHIGYNRAHSETIWRGGLWIKTKLPSLACLGSFLALPLNGWDGLWIY